MISNTVNLKQQHSDRFHGTLQALFAVMLFSLTVPFTQLALADFQAAFIASSRALIAGLLAWMIIYKHGWKMPAARVIPWLLLAGSGVVLGFPYFLSLSLTQATAADMGVVLAGLPLTTALMGAWIQHERHGPGFWLAAISGGLLLASYVLLNTGGPAVFDSGHLGLLLATLLMGGIGYSAGAKAATLISGPAAGWQTICWTLLLYLPVSAFWWGNSWADQAASTGPIANTSILALLYLILISQLWGFKFWYQALAAHGVGRISQLQLLQPFFTLLFISLLLQQSIGWLQLLFCCLIVFCVWLSQTIRR